MQNGRPIAFMSKHLSMKHQALSTYEKELLTIVMATQKWHCYLQGHHFKIRTDHQSLKYLLEQRLSTLFQQKWLAKLMGLEYEICYKQGKENLVADALSRLNEVPEENQEGQCQVVSARHPSWLQGVIYSYNNDPEAQAIISGIVTQNSQYVHITYDKGILKSEGRIYVGAQGASREQILWECYDSAYGGHSGQDATFKKISQFFIWPGLKQEVKNYVDSCDICQRIKSGTSFPGGLLQPLPIPSQVWEDLSMDFIEGLPKSGDKDCILVIVDRFSKMGHFVPLSHFFSNTVSPGISG